MHQYKLNEKNCSHAFVGSLPLLAIITVLESTTNKCESFAHNYCLCVCNSKHLKHLLFELNLHRSSTFIAACFHIWLSLYYSSRCHERKSSSNSTANIFILFRFALFLKQKFLWKRHDLFCPFPRQLEIFKSNSNSFVELIHFVFVRKMVNSNCNRFLESEMQFHFCSALFERVQFTIEIVKFVDTPSTDDFLTTLRIEITRKCHVPSAHSIRPAI